MQTMSRDNYDNPSLSTGLTVGGIFADYESQVLANRKALFLNASESANFHTSVYNQLTAFANANAEASRRAYNEAKTYAAREINRSFNEGIKRVDAEIKAYEKQGFKPKQVRDVFKSNRLMFSLATTLGGLAGALAVANDAANRQVLQIASIVNPDAENLTREIDDKQRIFLKKGLAGTYNKNGIATEISAVAELQMRQDSHKALLQAQGERSEEYGLYLIQVSAHPSSCPLCAPWQTRVLIDDVYKGGKADGEHELLSTAISAGLYHYNCRHTYITFIPGYSRKEIFDYDKASKEQTAERYAIEQEQRYNERAIREWKRIEQGSLNEQDRLLARRRVEEWQARQRALEKYAEQKRLPFYRQYQREAIGGETKPTVSPYNPNATLTESSEVIREPRDPSVGTPIGVAWGSKLSKNQTQIDNQLPVYNARMEVPKKKVSMQDLSALTAKNGVEYALFTKGQTRLIIRGDETHVHITPDVAEAMAKDGWKWSGHTHRESGAMSTMASDGDLLILNAFGQRTSVIYNALGKWKRFGEV